MNYFPGKGRALEKALFGARDLQSTQHKHQDVPPPSHQHCSSSTCPLSSIKDNDFQNPASIPDVFSATKPFTFLRWRRREDFQDGAPCALWPGESLLPPPTGTAAFALRPQGNAERNQRCAHVYKCLNYHFCSPEVLHRMTLGLQSKEKHCSGCNNTGQV